MATIDWVVGGIISIIGFFILYKALKEPMDLLFGFIGRGIRGIIGLFSSAPVQYEEIRYG